ncbi:ATP-binding protein involved in chromosome partitioning [Limimonas halophila]|uniref:Iron-sulfur cluster carrier protein n=1 Tax=Limimonas halophila TaxID=1082479 RepID=A0A1G7PWE8_9PROT|nr:Mrp/NBP35 family ATP-binding protein [Limimonas halophila]SDF90667.1 ATP-binding protein involved in chromosome partitioning [Limimonas halophila]
MSRVTEDSIYAALRNILDPASGQDLVTRKMVTGLVVKDGNVGFAIEIDPQTSHDMEAVRKRAEQAVLALDGVSSVTAVLTAHTEAPGDSGSAGKMQQQAGGAQQHGGGHRHGHGQGHAQGQGQGQGSGQRGGDQRRGGTQQAIQMPGVRAIVAVASGKGGVGKSTTAANLALAAAREGHRVGLLDADIYGPSAPRMMGVSGKPELTEGKRLIPKEAHGIKVMSMGFLVDEDTPTVWRGPMVQTAIQQMLRDVEWGELDLLIVDMPPGTGDAQLTLSQQVPLAGAAIVTTPQDLALTDANKGLNMFRKVDVPVLGFIENMSYFQCPSCGERHHVFAEGGGRREAARLGTELLGEIPLDIVIRETSDGGNPVVVAHPESPHAAAYGNIARRIAEQVLDGGATRQAPKITMS